MDKLLLFVITLILGHSQEQPVNLERNNLKNEFDSIYKLDQKYRDLMGDTLTNYGWPSRQMDALGNKQSRMDSGS